MVGDSFYHVYICYNQSIVPLTYKIIGVGGAGKIYQRHANHRLTMTTKPLPPLTPKQQAILKLLYRYRFLNRIQVQSLLGHKDKRRIISWLKDLRDKEYVDWHYNSNDFIAKSQPAIYYLSLNGIRYLRSLNQYPNEELRKRYKEPARTKAFIDRCLLIADCCIALKVKSGAELQYTWLLPADYADPDCEYSFLDELKPHLCFIKQNDEQTTGYLLEVLDPLMPRYAVRKRVKDYVKYLVSGDWQDETGYDEPPVILVTCPTVADLIYAKRRAKTEIENNDLNDNEASRIRFATIEKIKELGVTARVWEEI